MPIITIKMLEGRTDIQKENLIEEVTKAVSDTVNAPKENIMVVIEEMQPKHYGVAGVSKSKK